MTSTSRTLRMMRPYVAAAAAAMLLAGCGASNSPEPDPPSAPTLSQQFPSAPAATPESPASESASGTSSATAPAGILIKGFRYQESPTVGPGAVITVTNQDIETHTVTADTGNAFDLTVQPGTGTFTAPKQSGTYQYHCIFHGNMRGTLTVK